MINGLVMNYYGKKAKGTLDSVTNSKLHGGLSPHISLEIESETL
jgi:hypothetical protein